MPDLLIGALGGILLGAAGATTLLRRQRPAPQLRLSLPPVSEPTVRTGALDAVKICKRSDDADFAVASAVLAVADRLTSTDLRRRLNEALALLPGVVLIAPGTGDAFDPDLHVWDTTVGSTEAAPESVARTTVAGLRLPDGSVARKARVTVFDRPDGGDSDGHPNKPEPRSSP